MVNSIYAKAYTEVLEIIKYFPKEEFNKLPKGKIEFYKNNMDKNYNFTINPEIDLKVQNVSKEAGAILVTLFRDYFATEEQKQKIEELIILNEKKSEITKRKKYNPNNLFKNNKEENVGNEYIINLPIEIKKDNFFFRLIKFLKNLIKK